VIFFCEECGRKQTLGPGGIREGIVRFTCAQCGFSNAYPVPGQRRSPEPDPRNGENRTPERQMSPRARRLLEALHASGEVLGVFLIRTGRQVRVSADSVPGFEAREIRNLGELVAECHGLGRDALGDVDELTVGLDDSLVLCRNVADRLYLAVITRGDPLSPALRGLTRETACALAGGDARTDSCAVQDPERRPEP
jgi:hypothetical protein